MKCLSKDGILNILDLMTINNSFNFIKHTEYPNHKIIYLNIRII